MKLERRTDDINDIASNGRFPARETYFPDARSNKQPCKTHDFIGGKQLRRWGEVNPFLRHAVEAWRRVACSGAGPERAHSASYSAPLKRCEDSRAFV